MNGLEILSREDAKPECLLNMFEPWLLDHAQAFSGFMIRFDPAKDYHAVFGRPKRRPETAIEAAIEVATRSGKMKAWKKILRD